MVKDVLMVVGAKARAEAGGAAGEAADREELTGSFKVSQAEASTAPPAQPESVFYFNMEVLRVGSFNINGSYVTKRKPDFEFLNAGNFFTTTASEPFVWAARMRLRKRRRKRVKRAGVLVRLRLRPLLPPLPTILLSNVQSLDNKLCGTLSHTNEKHGTAALFASQKPGRLQRFQTQSLSSWGSPCTARTERKSSQLVV
ncbi:uncharacterized protein LOC113651947 isoform X1 [Tachysurus ichikawai]